MNNVTEFLPFLVPLVISELALLAYTLYHILTHKSYKRGNRTLWLIVVIVGMQFIGPILYAFIAHTVQQRVKLPPPGGFLRIAVREEKLIYRNMIPGYKVIEYL